MPLDELIRYCGKLVRMGYTTDDFLVDESAPDERVQLQAEVMRDERYLYVMYALCSGVGIRQVIGWKHARGMEARALLDRYLDANARECLEEILTDYDDAVVELSAYDCAVGVLGWNTLTWEVRTTY